MLDKVYCIIQNGHDKKIYFQHIKILIGCVDLLIDDGYQYGFYPPAIDIENNLSFHDAWHLVGEKNRLHYQNFPDLPNSLLLPGINFIFR